MPGTMSVSAVGSTQMACPEPIMALESRYLKALEREVQYSFLAGKFALTSIEGEETTTMLFAQREKN